MWSVLSGALYIHPQERKSVPGLEYPKPSGMSVHLHVHVLILPIISHQGPLRLTHSSMALDCGASNCGKTPSLWVG